MSTKHSQIRPMLRAVVAASALTLAVSSVAIAQDSMDAGMTSGKSIQSSQPEPIDSPAGSDEQPTSDDDSDAESASGGDYGSSNYHTPSQPVENPSPSDASPSEDSADDEAGMAPDDSVPSQGTYSDAPASDADNDPGADMGQATDPDMAGSEDD